MLTTAAGIRRPGIYTFFLQSVEGRMRRRCIRERLLYSMEGMHQSRKPYAKYHSPYRRPDFVPKHAVTPGYSTVKSPHELFRSGILSRHQNSGLRVDAVLLQADRSAFFSARFTCC